MFATVGFAWNGLARGRGTLALGAGYRSVEVDGIEYEPWLLVGELSFPLSPRVTFSSEAWTGKGFASEFLRYGLDYNTATGSEIAGAGGFASLGLKATEKTTLNFGYGMDDPKDEDLIGYGMDYAERGLDVRPTHDGQRTERRQIEFFSVNAAHISIRLNEK